MSPASVAASVAEELDTDDVRAGLLPQDKLELVAEMQAERSEKETLIFVGDGVNDVPVLAKADLGVAMGAIGADAAIEAADVVLIDDRPSKVALAVRIARKTLRIVWENIVFAIAVKLAVLIPNLLLGENAIPLWLAVFADVGVCLIAVMNSARALYIKE